MPQAANHQNSVLIEIWKGLVSSVPNMSNKKRERSMRNSSKTIALAGMLSALAVVFLLLGAMVELLDLSAAAMASLVVMVAIIELGKGRACGVYAVSALLSVLLFPQTATVAFAMFLGYYPILKVFLDRIKPLLLQYAAKLLCFNAFLLLAFWLIKKLIGAESAWLEGSLWMLFLLGNANFLVFDFALAKLALFYIVKIKNRMRK